MRARARARRRTDRRTEDGGDDAEADAAAALLAARDVVDRNGAKAASTLADARATLKLYNRDRKHALFLPPTRPRVAATTAASRPSAAPRARPRPPRAPISRSRLRSPSRPIASFVCVGIARSECSDWIHYSSRLLAHWSSRWLAPHAGRNRRRSPNWLLEGGGESKQARTRRESDVPLAKHSLSHISRSRTTFRRDATRVQASLPHHPIAPQANSHGGSTLNAKGEEARARDDTVNCEPLPPPSFARPRRGLLE